MEQTLGNLNDLLRERGFAPTLCGDPQVAIRGVSTLEEAQPGQITFLSNPKYERLLASTRASAIVVRPDVAAPPGRHLLRVADPYAAITLLIVELHGYRQHPPPPAGAALIDPSARIGAGARIFPGVTICADVQIGDRAIVYPGCFIGPGCRIGDGVLLYANVVIYDATIIGDRVTIHSGTVVGNDGLGYAPVGGRWVKIPQIGIVEIGDDVEIGSNCSIDRATLGRTRIASGTKLSNLIAIGHGAHVGEHCMLVAQVGLAGSVSVGHHVTLAGQAGVVGHIRIGDRATVAAKAGVTNNVADGETVLGSPALPIREMRRQFAYARRLPELNQAVRRLERELAELRERLSTPAAPVEPSK